MNGEMEKRTDRYVERARDRDTDRHMETEDERVLRIERDADRQAAKEEHDDYEWERRHDDSD